YKGFYTHTAIHNGENGEDQDGKLWHTATIGWNDKDGVELAASFSNGKYSVGKTTPQLDFAYANAFMGYQKHDKMFLLEGTVGEEKEIGGPKKTRFWDWHLDGSYPIFKDGFVALA